MKCELVDLIATKTLARKTNRHCTWRLQTPIEFTNKICAHLASLGYNPTILLRPTVETGNFVFSALNFFPRLHFIYAVDSQARYEDQFRTA